MPPRNPKTPPKGSEDGKVVELDSWGRKKAVPGSVTGVKEVQVWREMGEDDQPTGVTKKVERLAAPEGRRCIAKYGPRSCWYGNRCVGYAIKGGRVCNAHGGKLPTIKKNAQRNLAMAANGAAERLIHMALKKRNVPDQVRLKAICEVLDRAGVTGKTTIEVELKPWQELMRRVAGELPRGAGADGEEVIELVEGEDYEVEEDDLDDLED